MPSRIGDDLIRMTAREVLARLNAGDITHAEVLNALEARVAAVDGPVNALPTLCFDRARDHAARIAARPVAERGILGGLPVPIKDLEAVAGVRSTQGSPIYADHVPETSNYIVERIEACGGVVYAKSNTPEFGAGSRACLVEPDSGFPWRSFCDSLCLIADIGVRYGQTTST